MSRKRVSRGCTGKDTGSRIWVQIPDAKEKYMEKYARIADELEIEDR